MHVGLFYDGIGNEIGVEMAIGEANRLNVAAAVAAVKAIKDEEEARLRAERDEQRRAELEDTAATDAEQPALDPAEQSPDEARGMLLLLLFVFTYLLVFVCRDS